MALEVEIREEPLCVYDTEPRFIWRIYAGGRSLVWGLARNRDVAEREAEETLRAIEAKGLHIPRHAIGGNDE